MSRTRPPDLGTAHHGRVRRPARARPPSVVPVLGRPPFTSPAHWGRRYAVNTLLVLAIVVAVLLLLVVTRERRRANDLRRGGFTIVRGRRQGVVFTVDHGRRELDLTALAWLLWRYRHHLAPLYCGLLLWLAGLTAYHGLDRTPAVSLIAGCALACSGWAWLRLNRGIERAYAVIVLAEAAGWLVTAHVLGPTDPNVVRLLVIGALIAAVPWWAHRRVRSQVRVERAIAAWPTVAESVGLAGSKLVNVVVSTWGWTGRLVLKGGQTIRDVHKVLRGIESGLRLPIGSVRAEPWHDRADVVVVRVVESDPHALPVVWPATEATTVAARLPIGLYDDGQICDLPLYDADTGTHHALVAGTNGSGKSGLLNLAAAHAASAPDAVLWGIDLKGGIELRPWSPVGDWLATTGEQAAAMLTVLRRIIDARGQAATQRVWQANGDHPVIVVLIDEAAELPRTATDDLDSIARRGRALGVQLTLATQYPTADAVGSTQVRAQLRTRAGFRFQRSTEAAAVLSRASGIDPATIRKNRPGCCYIEAAGAERPALVRCYWITDEHVAGVAQVHQDSQPVLDPVSVLAAGPEYAQRHRGRQQHRDHGGRHRKLDNVEAQRALRAALIATDDQGSTVEELCASCDRRKSWIYRQLETLDAESLVERTGRHGRYRATQALIEQGDSP
ncbi:MAG: hypothetical protein GEV09_17390 [Pseudonocardiaceae bacterium]|nr:hypothetical protein [Pseudonocardiaceae bacterium]